MKINWIVSWRFNDEEYSEGFEFFHTALARQLELEVFGQKATIHHV